MKYKNWDFASLSLKRVKTAIENIVAPPFRPDAKTAVQVDAIMTAGQAQFNALSLKEQELIIARADLNLSWTAAHDACVAVLPCMQSCYRSDGTLVAAINSLPIDDRTPPETLNRIKVIQQFWTEHPDVPGTSNPFVVGTLDLAGFTLLRDTLETKHSIASSCFSKWKSQAKAFSRELETIGQFVTAARVQGRSAYARGTPERAYIDAIPTKPATHRPSQAVITEAESNEAGFVHLLFEAEHATRFTVLHKGPGDLVFTVVADGEAIGYDPVNVAPGVHEYMVVPHNSRGSGPASAVVTIAVAAQAVA